MTAIRLFLVNAVLSSQFIPIRARGRVYDFLGISNKSRFSFGVFFGSSDVTLGRNTYVNASCFFDGYAPIKLGDNCLIGMHVLFLTSGHNIDAPGVYSDPIGKPITVGNGCWIGARSVILPGVVIGDNVVIAAGSVVTKSIDTAAVYGGTPARWLRDV